MTHSRFIDSRRRLAVLGAAIVVVVAALLFLLFSGEPGDQEIIGRRLDAAIRDFETRKLSIMPKYFTAQADFHFRDSDITLDSDGITGTIDTIYKQYPSIDIRPKKTTVVVASDRRSADVNFAFQWTVTSTLYPNTPLKSEDMTDDERPAQATLHYVKVNEDWRIVDVILEIPE